MPTDEGSKRSQKKIKCIILFIEIIMNIDGLVLEKEFIVGTFLEF